MSSKEEFKHESVEDCGSVVKYLKVLSESFSNGHLFFCDKTKKIILKPTGLLKMKVKIQKRSNRVKLMLKLEWKDDAEKKLNIEPLIIESRESKG